MPNIWHDLSYESTVNHYSDKPSKLVMISWIISSLSRLLLNNGSFPEESFHRMNLRLCIFFFFLLNILTLTTGSQDYSFLHNSLDSPLLSVSNRSNCEDYKVHQGIVISYSCSCKLHLTDFLLFWITWLGKSNPIKIVLITPYTFATVISW